MIELYGIPMATCARKALLPIFEKDAPVVYREVDRSYLSRPEFRRLNPAGLVPTLVIDGKEVLTESSIIMRFVDESFDGVSLQPAAPIARARMNYWLKLVDEKYFDAISALTIATYIRTMLGTPLDEDRMAVMLQSVADEGSRHMREDAIRNGVRSLSVKRATASLADMLKRMESVLRASPWLAGATYSLADCAVAPLVLRLDELGLGASWQDRMPSVAGWWHRLADRPAARRMVKLADPTTRAQLTESAAAVSGELLAAMIQR